MTNELEVEPENGQRLPFAEWHFCAGVFYLLLIFTIIYE
jgi:hypothetical protein